MTDLAHHIPWLIKRLITEYMRLTGKYPSHVHLNNTNYTEAREFYCEGVHVWGDPFLADTTYGDVLVKFAPENWDGI